MDTISFWLLHCNSVCMAECW